jgi:ABC-type lipoprotein release transport system permease subunit
MVGESGGGAQVSGVTMSQVLYVQLYPEHAAYIAIAVVVATLAAGLYPAYKAGRVSPVEAIRIV